MDTTVTCYCSETGTKQQVQWQGCGTTGPPPRRWWEKQYNKGNSGGSKNQIITTTWPHGSMEGEIHKRKAGPPANNL